MAEVNDSRISALESSVAKLAATVDSLVSAWKTERVELHSAINEIRTGSKFKTGDIAAWVMIVIVITGMAGTLVVRELGHIEEIRDYERIVSDKRLTRNESMFLGDHDEVVRNSERWRLWEERLLPRLKVE